VHSKEKLQLFVNCEKGERENGGGGGLVRNITFKEDKKHTPFLPGFEGSQGVPALLLVEVNLGKGKVSRSE
jgi:hypothetical protein